MQIFRLGCKNVLAFCLSVPSIAIDTIDRPTRRKAVESVVDVGKNSPAQQHEAIVTRSISINAAGEVARVVGEEQSSKKPGVESKKASEANETVGTRAQLRSDALTAQRISLSRSHDISQMSGIGNNATKIKSIDKKFTSESKTLSNYIQKGSQNRSGSFIQTYTDAITILMASRGKGVSALLMMLLILIVLLAIALGFIVYMKIKEEKQCLQEEALKDLCAQAQQALQHALLAKEYGDWSETLNKFRELREEDCNYNHPLYKTTEAYMEEPETQTQLRNLFSEMSEGSNLTVENVKLIFTSLVVTATKEATGQSYTLSDEAFKKKWLLDEIKQPLPYAALVSIWSLYHVIESQRAMIRTRGDGSTQADPGEQVPIWHIEYCVEIRGRVLLRTKHKFGNFQREQKYGAFFFPTSKGQENVPRDRR